MCSLFAIRQCCIWSVVLPVYSHLCSYSSTWPRWPMSSCPHVVRLLPQVVRYCFPVLPVSHVLPAVLPLRCGYSLSVPHVLQMVLLYVTAPTGDTVSPFPCSVIRSTDSFVSIAASIDAAAASAPAFVHEMQNAYLSLPLGPPIHSATPCANSVILRQRLQRSANFRGLGCHC